jgi:hypothetical protein
MKHIRKTCARTAALASITLTCFAATPPQFDGNSARISHPFVSLAPGSKFVYSGFGESAGQTLTTTVVAEELVDGIKTVKVTEAAPGEPLFVNWYAQDTDGNIWGLRSIDGGLRQEDYMKWPAALTPGTTFVTQFGEFVSVTQIGLTVQTPAGTFQNCVQVHLDEPGTGYAENFYLAPGVGVVRGTDHQNGAQLGGYELKSYLVTRPVTVTIEGKGTVSIKNGQLLQLGKQYSASAVPASGYAFRGWTSPTNSLKSPLSLTMHEGLILSARFEDVGKPSVVVTQPKANQRILAPELLVRGTAKDNEAVAAVRVQLNDGEWATAAGTLIWSNLVTLVAGPNKLRVYAEDAAGNRSATNTVTLTYVKTQPFTVTIFGAGKISPNLNSQPLEVGKRYTVTAVPGSLWKFQRWDGTIPSTNKTLTFTMPDQPVQEALHFNDAGAPTVTVASPKAGARVTATSLTIQGTAKDNLTVWRVNYRIDGGDWQLASGSTNWNAQIALSPGSHTLQVYAEDTYGNRSKTNLVAFRVPDYSGIYFGTYSEPEGRGSVGILVTADQRAVIITGDTTAEFDSATVIDAIEIGIDGKFDETVNGERIFGTFTDTGFSGKFITTDNMTGTFLGTKKPSTGVQVNNVGYYVGTYQMPGETGVARAMLAADGKILLTALSEPLPGEGDERAGGAGTGTVNALGAINVPIGGTRVTGVLNSSNPTPTISGSFQAESGMGTMQLTRILRPSENRNTQLAMIVTAVAPIEPAYVPLNMSMSGTESGSVDSTAPGLPPTVTVINVEAILPSNDAVPTIVTSETVQTSVLELNDVGGGFGFVFSTEVGRTYRVQASADLANWSDVLPVFTAGDVEYQFVDPNVSEGRRFYRVIAE